MSTSWTQTDIDALEAAIKSGVLEVQFGDRRVRYHSISEMLQLLQTMKETLAAASGSAIRSTYATFSKG